MARLVIEVKGKNAEEALKRLRKEAKALGGTVRRLEPAVNRADKSLARMAKTSSFLTTAVKGLILGIGVRGLTRALKGATDAAIEQAQAQAQVQQGLISTKGVSGQTLEGLIALASGFQKLTLFEDEAILRAESILLTFTKIQGDTFPATTRAVLDLATRMGGDLSAAAVQLGKALNDPVANLGELGRAGIQFTKDQKLVIKSLFEGGDAASAQAIILEELTRQFGGSAEAAAKAGGGGIKQFTIALGDAQEVLGEQLLPTLDELGRKGVVILSHTAEAAALAKVGFITLGIAVDRVKISFAKFTLVMKQFGAFLLGPWSAAQDKVVADLELQIARWEILAGGSVLRARQAYEEYLDAAARAGSASKALAEALSGGGAGGGGVGGAAKAAFEVFEDGIDVVDDLTKRLEEGLVIALDNAAEKFDQLGKTGGGFLEIDNLKGLLNAEGEIDFLPDFSSPSFKNRLKEAFKDIGSLFGDIFTNSILDALAGNKVNFQAVGEQIGSAIGFAIGTAAGGTGQLGASIGAIAGSLTGGLFGGGGGDAGPTFAERVNDLSDDITDMLDSAGGFIGQITDVFNDINVLVQESVALGQDLGIVMDAAKVKVEDLRDTILGIDIEDFGNRLAAAFRFNQGLGLVPFGQPPVGAGHLGGSGGTTGGEGGLPTPSFGAVIGGAERFNQTLDEQVGLYDVAGINLAEFGEQLAAEFAGVSFEFQSVQATADALRGAIAALNLTEEEQVRLIGLVTQAEQIRMATLENDVLQRLVNVLSQIPAMQEDAAKLQNQINQARFQIEVKMIEMQLNALGLMTDAFSAMLKVAVAFGQELSNFNVSLGGRSFRFRAPRGFRSGGGGGGIDETQRDMDALIATLQGLASEPAFNTLNDRMRELHQTFFGPGGFAEEARRLGVSMDLVNAAFRRQRQNLMDEANRGIRQFLEGLGTSRFNPGGIGAQFGSAQSTFNQLLAQANRGDLDARAALPDAAQQLLDFGGQALGTSSAAFRHLFEMVQGSLEGILGVRGGNVLGFEVRAQVLATNEVRDSVNRVGDILLGTFVGGGAAGQTAAVQSNEQIAQLQSINVQLVNLQRETAELRADRRAERLVAPRKHQRAI